MSAKRSENALIGVRRQARAMQLGSVMDALVRFVRRVTAAVHPIAIRSRALIVLTVLTCCFVPRVALARGGHGGGGHSGGGHSGGGHFGGGHFGGGHTGGGHIGGGSFGGGHFGGGHVGSNVVVRGNSGSPISTGHISISGRAGGNVSGHVGTGNFRNQYYGRHNVFGRAYIGPSHVVVAPRWGRGYWGWSGGTWLWIDGNWWVTPEYPDWIWIGPEWVWDGTQWVLQPGYWVMANP